MLIVRKDLKLFDLKDCGIPKIVPFGIKDYLLLCQYLSRIFDLTAFDFSLSKDYYSLVCQKTENKHILTTYVAFADSLEELSIFVDINCLDFNKA